MKEREGRREGRKYEKMLLCVALLKQKGTCKHVVCNYIIISGTPER